MSLKTTTIVELDRRLAKFFSQSLVRDSCNLLRDQVLDSSNLWREEFVPREFHCLARKLPELVLLGLLQWYVDENVRWLINLWLEEHWGKENLELRHCLNTSKDFALGAILVQEKWSDRDFFGNILRKEHLEHLRKWSYRKVVPSRPKKTQRKRGYRDHGSMRLPHESEPRFDYRKFLSVIELEERRWLEEESIDRFCERVKWRLKREGVM